MLTNSLLLPTTGTIKFWRPQDISTVNFVIPIMRGEDVDQRGEWPGGKFPAWSSIKEELTVSRSSYISIKKAKGEGEYFLSFLAGRYLVNTVCTKSRTEGESLRINLWKKKGIMFANNDQRKKMAINGIRIEHKGLALINLNEFRSQFESQRDLYRSGAFAKELVALEIKQPIAPVHVGINEEEDIVEPLVEAEEHFLRMIETYVDAEYFLEEQAARATEGFAFVAVTPETQIASIRKYFRFTLLPSDHRRLKELAPGMLVLESGEEDRSLQLKVDDLSPKNGKNQIVVSTAEQLAVGAIPDAGHLVLFANPIQKNVRMKVVENLRQRLSPNKWLLPLAAQTYNHSPLLHQSVPIPPKKNPPNPSQVSAINAGAGSNDYMLVLGPPGTGKTTVILEWVRYFASQNKRVLISSQNNKAVDNVLERLAENPMLTCVRLGNEGAVSSSVRDLLIDNCASTLQRKLIESLEQNMIYLSNFEGMCSATMGLAKARATIQEFVESLTTLQSYVETSLTSLQRFLETICSGTNTFSAEELNALLEKKRSIPEELERLEEQRNSQTSQITLKRDQRLLELTERAREETEQLISSHDLHIAELQSQHQNFSGQQGIWGLVHKPAALWYSLRVKYATASHEKNILKIKERKEEHCELTTKQAATQIADAMSKHNSLVVNANAELQSIDNSIQDFQNVMLKRLGLASSAVSKINAQTKLWHQTITNQRQEALYSVLLNFVDVVGATCIGINTNKFFKDVSFDVVIVDESGQIQLHNLAVPLSRAPKAILVGDHKQLPPIVNQELIDEVEARGEAESVDIDTQLLEKSWFELLWDSAPNDRKVMLDTQFRCPAVISNYISTAFYEGKYFAGKGMAEKLPLFSFLNSPLVFIDTSNLPQHSRQETTSRGADERDQVAGNVLETRLVLNMLTRALESDSNLGAQREIGIIVPYKLHVQEIQREIAKLQQNGQLQALTSPLGELVASVDSYQGQERDLIIFPFTRSNSQGKVGFLKDWRRLNVAMTRAKRQLVMIGDLSTLAKQSKIERDDSEFKKAMLQLKKFVQSNGQLIDAADFLPETLN